MVFCKQNDSKVNVMVFYLKTSTTDTGRRRRKMVGDGERGAGRRGKGKWRR